MSSFLKKTLPVLAGLLVGILLAYLLFAAGVFPTIGSPSPHGISDELANSPLLSALRVAVCIKEDDFAGLGEWIHPEKGVYFTPLSTVDLSTDRSFSAAEVSAFATDGQLYLWGVANGEGAPIQMTPLDYIRRYVGDRDYSLAPIISVGLVNKTGTRMENVSTVFPEPDYVFVEFHIPLLDPKWEGMDWSSLKVVFEEYQGSLKVVALIHSEWTM